MHSEWPNIDWVERLCAEVNRDKQFRKSARIMDWTVTFRVLRDDGVRSFSGVLKYGQCIRVWEGEAEDADIVVEAPIDVWIDILEERLDPLMALYRGKLRLVKGRFRDVVRYPMAAMLLIHIAKKIPR